MRGSQVSKRYGIGKEKVRVSIDNLVLLDYMYMTIVYFLFMFCIT